MNVSGHVARASIRDSIAASIDIAAPTIAKGVIIRRPRMVALAERFGLDDRAVRRMQKLRARYGEGPLLLRMPGRPRIVVLAADDVKRVLDDTPEPFATRTDEKYAALAHFEPKVALLSHGTNRAIRRRFNEEVLDTRKSVHGLADAFARVVGEEVGLLLNATEEDGKLDWPRFFGAWYRIVRRIVLGSGARDDHELTDMLAKLRARGNWAFFRRTDEELRGRFRQRLDFHLERAEAGSLASIVAAVPGSPATAPSHQVAQWLFAFDPGGMATFQTLALLATHPEQERRARAEIESEGEDETVLPFLRAAFLEALRLWPTTPAILRQTTREVEWSGSRLPANATVMIYAPFFHRDEERLAFAHRFTPDLWLDGDAEEKLPLVPFSRGPGLCPARNLVPLTASLVLARLMKGNQMALRSAHRLDPGSRLPGMLDNYSLAFDVVMRVPGRLPNKLRHTTGRPPDDGA